jgi:hypothetical protein
VARLGDGVGNVGEPPLRAPMGGVEPLPYIQGGPPPCHAIAPDHPCSSMVLALRLTWHPLTNHPNEPLAPVKAVRQ